MCKFLLRGLSGDWYSNTLCILFIKPVTCLTKVYKLNVNNNTTGKSKVYTHNVRYKLKHIRNCVNVTYMKIQVFICIM